MTIRPLLLGFTVPDDIAADLFSVDPSPAVQTHRFAWSLARSLRSAFGEVRLLSAAPAQSWPLTPRLIFRQLAFTQDGMTGVAVGFINMVAVKHLTRLIAVLLQTPTLRQCWRVNSIVIHGVHTSWLAYGRLLQLFGLHVTIVLTDPPGVILATDSPPARWLKRIDRRIVSYFVSRASSLVALAPDLVADYPGVPRSLVFPGIVSGSWLEQLSAAAVGPEAADEARALTVLYAGGVNAAYGVDRLLEAARFLPEVRFVIFGKGDQVARITPQDFPNVTYCGFLPPTEMAPHLLAADILINPRPSDASIARNSFPSKLLEYAATGRSVLTTRICSIPDAIAPCFDYIEDETPEGIARAIRTLGERPPAERLTRASQSRALIIKEYSEEAVGRKLADLIDPPNSAN